MLQSTLPFSPWLPGNSQPDEQFAINHSIGASGLPFGHQPFVFLVVLHNFCTTP